MITAIEIENFKGIGARQRIELKPLTLLFGPNSGGKSTILHALHYAREVLDRRNYDAGETVAGGKSVDLGGFQTFVHDRDLSKSVVMRLDVDMNQASWPVYFDIGGELDWYDSERHTTRVENASVEFAIRWSESLGRAYCASYSVSINGDFFGRIGYEPGRPEGALEINSSHAFWDELTYSCCPSLGKPIDEPFQVVNSEQVPVSELLPYLGRVVGTDSDALPRWGRQLKLVMLFPDDEWITTGELHSDISMLIARPGEVVSNMLEKMLYLGPLRSKPERNFAPRFPNPSRWSDGLAAWDALYLGAEDLVIETSEWLGRADRLATGYVLKRSSYVEIDVGDSNIASLVTGRAFDETDLESLRALLLSLPTRRRIVLNGQGINDHLLPNDVGEGLSQVVPVVVAVLTAGSGFLVIEQPELHVHPAVQVGIGDLLSPRVDDSGGVRLVETHSEHILLRLLRRIRETTDGTLPENTPGLKPDCLAVYYVEMNKGAAEARPLRIDETGEFLDRWPRGFFEERAQELFG